MRRITIRCARTWRWARMRPWVGRSSGPVSLSPSRSCPGCTTNTSGYDFRKGQAQLNALALGQLHQLLDRAMGEPGVGRMRDRLLLYSGIYRNPFEIFGVDRPYAVGHRKAFLQQRDGLLFTQPLAPARERRAIKRQLVPEHHFPAEVLEIRVLYPSLAQRLVGEVVHVLEDQQPSHQPRRQWRLPRSHATYRTEASRQKIPIDLPRKPHQRMAKVDDLLERRAKQVVLAIVARLAHRSPPTANLAVEGITDRPNRESQTARKPACHDYLLRSNHRDRSIAS